MVSDKNIFWQVMFEAEGDEQQEAAPEETSEDPPDIGGDEYASDDGGADANVDNSDAPPDMGGDEFSSDDSFGDEDGSDDSGEEKETEDSAPVGLDNKVSAILNAGLYKKNLALLSELTLKRNTIKDNIDVIRTLDPDAMEISENLQRLEDNIREYNDHTFLDENYSKNRLFYDKCLNMYNLLCQRFRDQMAKAIKKAGNT